MDALFTAIDVSHHQATIDFAKVKATGVDAVIVKAGGSDAGCYKDDYFERNYNAAIAANLHVGSYYYVGPKCLTEADGKADAKRFLEIIKGKRFDMPVYIDLEKTPTTNKAGATDAVLGFVSVMEQAGYYCGVYASAVSGFVNRVIDSRLTNIDHWVADYRGSCGYSGSASVGMWQYSETGKINGISGNVDLDAVYKNYPAIITAKGLNGYTKPETVEQAQKAKTEPNKIKITIEFEGKKYSGELVEG